MDADRSHDRLIAGLTADLKPVRRLPAPSLRALLWLPGVVGVALPPASFADLHGMAVRLTAAPDMWLAVTGSTLTAVLAAIAAFELSLPDASRGWALLP